MAKKLDELLAHFSNEGNVVSHTVPLAPDLARQIGVPQAWYPALTGQAKVSEQIRVLWEPLADLMPRTRAAYSKHCVALLALQTSKHPLSLLYCFDLGKIWMAQRGFPPSARLPDIAKAFPTDMGPFYRVHDGLVNFATGEDGPFPVSEWRLIPDPPRGGGLLEVLSEGGRTFGFDTGVEPVQAIWLDTDDLDEPVEQVDDAFAFLDAYLAKWLERKK